MRRVWEASRAAPPGRTLLLVAVQGGELVEAEAHGDPPGSEVSAHAVLFFAQKYEALRSTGTMRRHGVVWPVFVGAALAVVCLPFTWLWRLVPRRHLLLATVALALVGCHGNHAPTIVVVESPGLVRPEGFTRFSFRVDDADSDPLRVRLGVSGAEGGWAVTTNEQFHPPGAVVTAWFHARGAADAVVHVSVSDPSGAAAVLAVPVVVR
jgi:hypothetical protein